MDGILNIYKERGFTSHDVVAKLRGICHQRKIGHTGTLDPEAEGVLPVCLGQATKVCDLLTDKDKEYEAVLHLGVTTDTQDIFGQVLSEKPCLADEETVRDAVLSFTGEIMQIPPMYSAIKVQGKKLYELARAGKEIEREPRKVTVKEIRILEMNLPFVRFRVCCSKGTYVRTICHDIGEKLGCGGCMESLKRTRSGRFGVEDSMTLQEASDHMQDGTLKDFLIPADALFEDLDEVKLDPAWDKRLYNGNALPKALFSKTTTDTVRVYDSEGAFIALYRKSERDASEYLVEKFFMKAK